jgi:hypothetical protein
MVPNITLLFPDCWYWFIFFLYRLYNEPCATYETASLRKYQHGRTDTIRSCSIESLAFCKAMVDPNVSQDQKRELLRKAVNSHKNYVNDVGLLLHTHRFPNTVKPVLNDHLPYVTIFHCSLGKSHKTGLIVLLWQNEFLQFCFLSLSWYWNLCTAML